MRRVWLSALFAGLLLAGLPALLGWQAEQSYRELEQRLGLLGWQVERSDYRRGWFQSAAETDLRALPLPGATAEPLRMTLRSRILHGPLGSQGDPLLAEVETELLQQGQRLPLDHRPALLRTRIDFAGRGDSRLRLPAFELPANAQRPATTSEGGSGLLSFHLADPGLQGRFELAEVRLQHPTGNRLTGQGLRWDFDLLPDPSGLWQGKTGLEAALLELVSPAGGPRERIVLADLKTRLDSRLEGDRLRLDLAIQLARLEAADQPFGPASVRLRLEGLPAQELALLQQRPSAPLGLADLLPLLRGNPALDLSELRLTTPRGEIAGHLRLGLNGMDPSAEPNLLLALTKLRGKVSLRLPEAILLQVLEQGARQSLVAADAAEMARQRVEAFVQNGWLAREGDQLRLDGRLESGRLTLNGRPLGLPLGIR